MTFQSYQDVMLWKPPPVKSVIGGGILHEGTKLVIFGLPKRHKSVLAQQLAFCLSVGTQWIGFPTERLVVGYVQAEVPRPMFRLRTIKMGSNQTVPNNTLYFMTNSTIKLDRDSGMKDLIRNVEKVNPKVLIIDPIYKFTTGSEESTLLHFVDNMDLLISKYGMTIVLVHHSRKPKMALSGDIVDQGGSELRGPVIEQWADSIIRIQGSLDSDERVLDFELRHAEQMIAPITVKLDRQRLWFMRV
jgi:RecA-family ATPase